ncbi:hypothetical protein [Ferdinandcohnia sp. Marseille-Q9671]
MVVRKSLGFVITTLSTGVFLTLFFAVLDGFSTYNFFATLGVLLVGAAPFILLIGVPVSVLSDYVTKNVHGKQRCKKASMIHIVFGLIIGFILSYPFEHVLLVLLTLFAALLFWIVDEFLRKKFKDTK